MTRDAQHSWAGQVIVAVTRHIFILEVVGSNLGRDTDHTVRFCHMKFKCCEVLLRSTNAIRRRRTHM